MNNVKYPDAQFWIHYLDPVDATYLLLYSTAFASSKGSLIDSKILWPGKDKSGKDVYFDSDSDDSDGFSKTVDAGELIIGAETGDDKKYPAITVDITGSYGGHYTRYYPGSHDSPPEGGDSVVDDVDIDGVFYNSEVDEFLEITSAMFTKDYTYAQMLDLAAEILHDRISASDTEYSNKKLRKDLPQSLEENIKKVLEENKEQIRLKKATKHYGL